MQILSFPLTQLRSASRVMGSEQPQLASSEPRDTFLASRDTPPDPSKQLRALALSNAARRPSALEVALSSPSNNYSELLRPHPEASPEDKNRIGWSLGKVAAEGLDGARYAKDWLRETAQSQDPADRASAYSGYTELWKKGPLAQEDWNALATQPGSDLVRFVDDNWDRFLDEDRSRLTRALSQQLGEGAEDAYSSLRSLGLKPSAEDLRAMAPELDRATTVGSRLHSWMDQQIKESPDRKVREAAAGALLRSRLKLDGEIGPLTLGHIARDSDDPELKKAAAQRFRGPVSEGEQARFDKTFADSLDRYVESKSHWLASDKEKEPVFQLAQNYWALTKADDPKYKDHVDVKKIHANIGRLLQSQQVQDLRDKAAINSNLGLDIGREQHRYVTSEDFKLRLQLLPEGERTREMARELNKLQQFNPQLAQEAAQELSAQLASPGASMKGEGGEGEGPLTMPHAIEGAEKLSKRLLEAELAHSLLGKVSGGMSVLEAYDSFSTGDIGGGIGNSLSAIGTFFWPLKPVGFLVTLAFGDNADEQGLKRLGVYR